MARSRFLSRSNKWLLWLLTPCVVLAAGGVWLVATTSGLQWLTGVIERRAGGDFSAKGVSGSLLESFGMQHFVLRGDGWRVTVSGAQLHWQPTVLLRGKVNVLQLSAQQVDVLSLPSDQPVVLPDNLRLPLDVSVLQMSIGSLRLFSKEGAAPDLVAGDIEARFISDAQSHELQVVHLRLPYGELVGTGQVAMQKPFALKANATLDAPLRLAGKTETMRFTADVGGDLQRVDLKLSGLGAGMNMEGTAQLAPLSTVAVTRAQLTFNGLDTQWLSNGAPSARLAGSIELHGTKGDVLEGTVQVRNPRAAPLDRNGLPLLGLSARLRLSGAQWQIQQLDASFPNGGHILGTLAWRTRSEKGSAQLKVSELDPSVVDSRLPSTRLQGDITVDSIGDQQHVVLALSDGQVALQGELDRRGKQVELSSFRLSRGETVLSGHGQLALDRRRTFRMVSQLQKLNLAEFTTSPATDLNAVLEVSGTLLPEAAGALQFDLSHSRFAEHEIRGSGHVDFTGVHQVTGKAEVLVGDNRLNLDVAHGTDADHLQMELNAPDLAQLGGGLGGQLVGRANLSTSEAAPALGFSLVGNGLVVSGQRLEQLEASGALSEQGLEAQIGVTGYRSTGALTVPQANIELHGSRARHTVSVFGRIARGDEALGDLNASASGGLSDAAQGWQALQWQGALDQMEAGGVLPFHLVSAAPLTLTRDSLHLGMAKLAVSGGQIQFSDTQWTPQRWHSAGRFNGLNVRAVNMQRDKPEAFDSMRFGGSWDVTAGEHWQGMMQVQREGGDWVIDGGTGLRLGLRDMQLSLRAENDRLDARLDMSGEHLGEVAAQASVPLTQRDGGWTILPEAPLSGHLHLNSDDLSWLGPMIDSNLQSGGRMKLDADLKGSFLSPRLQGSAQGEALGIALLDQGVRLEQGQVALRFAPDALQLDRMVFSAPYQAPPRDNLLSDYKLPGVAGQLSASGRIDLEGGSGDLQIVAERLPLAQRTDRWIIASGNGLARYANHVLTLGGSIRADAGLINQPVSNRPRWSDDVQLVGQESASRPGTPYAVDAKLDLGEHFYIRASGLEARLAGKLDVHGEPGSPLSVTGIIAAQDALFDAYGQRLQVERGIVNFQGPLDDPGLNIRAIRKGLSVEAGVEVTGTVRRPTVALVSTPNVPDAEKLSWIVLGRVPDSSGVDTSLLLAAAGNILGGQSAGQLGRAIGVDELSLRQKETGNPLENPVVTVGKRLNPRAYLSYERGLADISGVTKFTYTLTPRFTIVTRTGTTEDALDLFYSFRFY